jgi:hypothetical protein
MTTPADRHEIGRAFDVLYPPGAVVEMRVPKTRAGTWSGYFDDREKFIQAGADVNGNGPGVYVTINPVDPVLFARACNRIRPRATETTSDRDVARRYWILLDFDPIRAAGISSTDAEHAAALAATRAARTWLASLGVPTESMVLADSGNGAHLLLHVDLPNDEPTTRLVQRCLDAVALHCGTAGVAVDRGVFNAGRIVKLSGAVAMKGDATAERPHRRAQLLEVPAVRVVVPVAVLDRIAATLPADDPRDAPPRRHGETAFDVRAWLAEHGLVIQREKPWHSGATVLELAACPFNPEHVGSAVVILEAGGRLLFRCLHDSCRDKLWRDVRARFEPAHAPERPRHRVPKPMIVEAEAADAGITPTPSAPPRISRRLSTILADPAALQPPAVVVPRLAWRGRTTLLAAREKAGKSTLATAAAGAVSRGAAWLGDATARGEVLWAALEEHVADLAARMTDWAADPERVHVLDVLAGLEDGMAALHAEARAIAPVLVVVDTLSAFVDAIGSRPDPGSSTAWTPIMTGLTRIARDTDAAVLIVHHARRSDGAYRDSSAIGAGVDAIVEMADGLDADVRVLRIRARWREGDYSVRLLGTADHPHYELATGELSLDARVLLHVEAHPGCSLRSLREVIAGRTAEIGAAVQRLLASGAVENRGDGASMALYPRNHSGNHPGSGGSPQGTNAEPPSGTTLVPDSKPLGGGSGTTPEMWGDV